jgi:hypothetical protein
MASGAVLRRFVAALCRDLGAASIDVCRGACSLRAAVASCVARWQPCLHRPCDDLRIIGMDVDVLVKAVAARLRPPPLRRADGDALNSSCIAASLVSTARGNQSGAIRANGPRRRLPRRLCWTAGGASLGGCGAAKNFIWAAFSHVRARTFPPLATMIVSVLCHHCVCM